MTLLLLLRTHRYGAIVKGYSAASDAQKYGATSRDAAASGSKASDA